MTDDPEKIMKKARKAAKKMRKAREELRAAKAEMRAARCNERGARGRQRGNGPHIRIETPDGVKEFEIPEELRRKGREFARTITGPLMRDLAAAGLIAAGAAIAAKARKKKPEATSEDGDTPDVEAAAEDLSDKANELGEALNALANAALGKFFGPKGFTTRH